MDGAILTHPAAWWMAVLLAALVASVAWRAGSLSRSGAVAACAIGAIAIATTWGVGLYLVAWFVLASLLSRVGRSRKAARVARIVAKGDQRDARQVLANGGIFAVASLGSLLAPAYAAPLLTAAAGALAAAGADTWSTEIGTLVGGTPWSLRTRGAVPAGTSGAVTWPGSLGGALGALTLAGMATVCAMVPVSALLSVAAGGLIGAWTDTAIGAWGQTRRWCSRCAEETEQDMHHCGTPTERRGGLAALDNDAVNFLCTVVGAVSAVVLSV